MQKYNWSTLIQILNERYKFNFFKQNININSNAVNFNKFDLEIKLDKFTIFNYDVILHKTLTNTRLIRYTYHQMFRYGLFVGSSVRTSLKTSRWMTMGFRSSFVFINLVTAHGFVRSVMKIVLVAMRRRRSILLSVNRPGAFFVGLIAHLANWCGEAYCGSRWVSGMLSNFRGVWRYFNLYLKKFKLDELTLNQQKLKVALQGLSFLKSKPRMIFFGNYFYGYHGAKEALREKCAPICVVDSDVFPDHVLYPLPSNDDSFSSNEFYIRIIAKSALIGKLYYVMRFYKYKKMAAFNNIVLEKGIHWWDAISRFFTKRKITLLVNQMAKRKKKRYYLFKYLLKFLFLNFFDLVLDSKDTTPKIMNVRRYISFFMLYSVYLRIFGDRFLMLKNFNVNFFFLFDMFTNLSKVLKFSDESLLNLNASKDYYYIIGSYFKKHFFENFLHNFFKVTPFFYFSFLVKSLANWKVRNFDINFRKSLITKKWYYWAERITERQRLNKVLVQEWHFIQTSEIYENFINFNRLESLTDKVLYDLNLEANNITNYLTYDMFKLNIEVFLNFIETSVFRLYGNPFYKNMYLYHLNNWETGRTSLFTKDVGGSTGSFFNVSYKKYALFIRFFKQNLFELSIQFPLIFGALSNSKINISSGELIEFRRFFQKAFGFKASLNFKANVKIQPLKYVFDAMLLKSISGFTKGGVESYVQNHAVGAFYKEYYKNSKQFFGVLLAPKLSSRKLEGSLVLESKYGELAGNIQQGILTPKFKTNSFFSMLDTSYSDLYLTWDLTVLKFFNFFYEDFRRNKGFFFLNYMRTINERSGYIASVNKLQVNNMYESGLTKLKLIFYFKKLFVYVYFILKNLNNFKYRLGDGLCLFNFFVKIVKKLGFFLTIFTNLRKLMFKFFFINYFKVPLQKEFFFFRFFLLNASLFAKLTFNGKDVNYKNVFKAKYSINQHTTTKFFVFLSKIRLFKLFVSKNLFSPLIKRLYLHRKTILNYAKDTKLKIHLERSTSRLNQNFFSNFLFMRNYTMNRLILFKTKLFELLKLGFVLVEFKKYFVNKSNKFFNYFKKTNYAYLHVKFKLIHFFTFLTYGSLLKKRFIKQNLVFNKGKNVRSIDRLSNFFVESKGLYWLFLKINYKLRLNANLDNAVITNKNQLFLQIFSYWYALKKNIWRTKALQLRQRLYFNKFTVSLSSRLISTKVILAINNYFYQTSLFVSEFKKSFFTFKLVNFFFFKQSIWFFFIKLFFNAVKNNFIYSEKLLIRGNKRSDWNLLKIHKLKKSSLIFFDSLYFKKFGKFQIMEEWIVMRNGFLKLLKQKLKILSSIFVYGKKKIRFLKTTKNRYKLFLRKIFYFIKYLRLFKVLIVNLTFWKSFLFKIRIKRLVNLKNYFYNQFKLLVMSSLVSGKLIDNFKNIFKIWYVFVVLKKRISFFSSLCFFFEKNHMNFTNLIFFYKQCKVFYFLHFFEKGLYRKCYLRRITNLFFGDLSKLSSFWQRDLVSKLLDNKEFLQISNVVNFEKVFLVTKKKNLTKSLCFKLNVPFIQKDLSFNFYFIFNKKINVYPYFYYLYINFIQCIYRFLKNDVNDLVFEKDHFFIITKPLTKRYLIKLLSKKFRNINIVRKNCIFNSKFKNFSKKKMMTNVRLLLNSFYTLKMSNCSNDTNNVLLNNKLVKFCNLAYYFQNNGKVEGLSDFVSKNRSKKEYSFNNKFFLNFFYSSVVLNFQKFVEKRFKSVLTQNEKFLFKPGAETSIMLLSLRKKKLDFKKFKYLAFVFKLKKKIYKYKRLHQVFKLKFKKNKTRSMILLFHVILKLVKSLVIIIDLVKKYIILYFQFKSLRRARFVHLLKCFSKIWCFFNKKMLYCLKEVMFIDLAQKKFQCSTKLLNENLSSFFSLYNLRKSYLEKKIFNFFSYALKDAFIINFLKNVTKDFILLLKTVFVKFITLNKGSWFFRIKLKLRVKFFAWFCKQFIKVQQNSNGVKINNKNIYIYSSILKKFCTFNFFKRKFKKISSDFFFQKKKKYRILYMKKRFGFNKRRHFWRLKYFFLFLKLFKNKLLNKHMVFIKEKRIWWIFWFKFFYNKLLLKKKISRNFFFDLYEKSSNLVLSDSNTQVTNRFFFKLKNKLVILHQLRNQMLSLSSKGKTTDNVFTLDQMKSTLLKSKVVKITSFVNKLAVHKYKKYYFKKRIGAMRLKSLFFMYRKFFSKLFNLLYNNKMARVLKLLVWSKKNEFKLHEENFLRIKPDKRLLFRILNYNIGAENLVTFGTNNLVNSYYKVRGYFNCIFNMLKLNLKKDVMLDWSNLDKLSKNFGLYFKRVYFWNSMVVPFWVRDQFFFFKNYQQIFAKIKQWIFFIISKISDLDKKNINFKHLVKYLTLKYFKILKMKDYYIWYMWLLKDLNLFIKPVSFQFVKMTVYGRVFRLFALLRDRLLLSRKFSRGFRHISIRKFKSKAFVKTKRSFIRSKSFFIFRRKKIWRRFGRKYRTAYRRSKRRAWFYPVGLRDARFTRRLNNVLKRRKTRRNNVWWAPFVSRGLLLFDKKRRVGLGIYRYKQKVKTLRMFSKHRRRGRGTVRRYLKWRYRKMGKRFPRRWKNRDLPIRHVKFKYLLPVRKHLFGFSAPKIKRGRFSLFFNKITNDKLRLISKYFFQKKKYSENLIRFITRRLNKKKVGYVFGFYVKVFRLLTKQVSKTFKLIKKKRRKKHRFFRLNTLASFYTKNKKYSLSGQNNFNFLFIQRNKYLLRKRLFMPFKRLYSSKKRRVKFVSRRRGRKFRRKFKKKFYKRVYNIFKSNKVNKRFYIDRKMRWFYIYIKRTFGKFLFLDVFQKMHYHRIFNLFFEKINKNFNIFNNVCFDLSTFKRNFIYFMYFWLKPFNAYLSWHKVRKKRKKAYRNKSDRFKFFINVRKKTIKTMRRFFFFRKKRVLLKLKRLRFFYLKWQFNINALRFKMYKIHKKLSLFLTADLGKEHLFSLEKYLKLYFIYKQKLFTFILLCYILVLRCFKIPLKYVCVMLSRHKFKLFEFLLTFFKNLKFLFLTKKSLNFRKYKKKRMSFFIRNKVLSREKNLLKNLWKIKLVSGVIARKEKNKSMLSKKVRLSNYFFNFVRKKRFNWKFRIHIFYLFRKRYIFKFWKRLIMFRLKTYNRKELCGFLFKKLKLMFKKHQFKFFKEKKNLNFVKIKQVISYFRDLLLSVKFKLMPDVFKKKLFYNLFIYSKSLSFSWFFSKYSNDFYIIIESFVKYYKHQNQIEYLNSATRLNYINFICQRRVQKKRLKKFKKALARKLRANKVSKRSKFSKYLLFFKLFFKKNKKIAVKNKKVFLRILKQERIWKKNNLKRNKLKRNKLNSRHYPSFKYRRGSVFNGLSLFKRKKPKKSLKRLKILKRRKRFALKMFKKKYSVRNFRSLISFSMRTFFKNFRIKKRKKKFYGDWFLANICIRKRVLNTCVFFLRRSVASLQQLFFQLNKKLKIYDSFNYSTELVEQKHLLSYVKYIDRVKFNFKVALRESFDLERFMKPVLLEDERQFTKMFNYIFIKRLSTYSKRKKRLFVADIRSYEEYLKNYKEKLKYFFDSIKHNKYLYKILLPLTYRKRWFKNRQVYRTRMKFKFLTRFQRLNNKALKSKRRKNLFKFKKHTKRFSIIFKTKTYNKYRLFLHNNYITPRTRYLVNLKTKIKPYYKKIKYVHFKTYNVLKTKYYVFYPIINNMQNILLRTLKKKFGFRLATAFNLSSEKGFNNDFKQNSYIKFLSQRKIRNNFSLYIYQIKKSYSYFQTYYLEVFDAVFLNNINNAFCLNSYKIQYFLKYIWSKNKPSVNISGLNLTKSFTYKLFLFIRRVFMHSFVSFDNAFRLELLLFLMKSIKLKFYKNAYLVEENLNFFFLINELHKHYNFFSKRFKVF